MGWKPKRGGNFYGTNVWSFEKRIDRVVQLIESKDSVISDLKIVVGDKKKKWTSNPKREVYFIFVNCTQHGFI